MKTLQGGIFSESVEWWVHQRVMWTAQQLTECSFQRCCCYFSQTTASSSASWRAERPPPNFVTEHEFTMWSSVCTVPESLSVWVVFHISLNRRATVEVDFCQKCSYTASLRRICTEVVLDRRSSYGTESRGS